MDDQDKVVVRSAEEIKESIISDLGLDPEADAERIEKLTARELDHDKKLSSAIGAKIKHRTEAEDLRKKLPPENSPVVEPKGDGLTTKDTVALMNAKVHEDDIDEVVEYAKFKKIPVSEALKTSVIKTALAEKAEQRKSAELANTGPTRRTVTQPSGEDMLAKARAGELPESDADINKLIGAKFQAIRKK